MAQELHALGAESTGERAVKRTVPWVASVAVHAGVLVIAVLVAGAVRLLPKEDQSPIIVADFDALRFDPVQALQLPPAEAIQPPVQDRIPVETLDAAVERELFEMELEPARAFAGAVTAEPPARFDAAPAEAGATFVGLSATNAQRIVYVIDGSGSLIASLQVVVQELARSLDGLTPRQSFSIIFFQQNRALVVPPGRLLPAEQGEKHRALEWINQHVIPSGNSNPLPALELALGLEPDVIFLLSDNITGAGQYEVDQRDLLATLERLNPADERGRRPVQINCIQFLDPDPLDTLARIAATHGGPRGYKFLDRAELGLAP